jgi:hypothetical protein
MIMTMIDVDPRRQSILYVVIEKDNLERMRKADPITLESKQMGGMLPVAKYPGNFSLLIAYEEDDAELYRMAKVGGIELLKWLERGRVFVPGLDGKGEAFKVHAAKREESNDGK